MGKIGLPEIDIVFRQKAVSAITRSERGVACIIVREAAKKQTGVKLYKYETDIQKSDYTADNLAAIKRAFLNAVNKVYVVSVTTEAPFTDVVAQLENIRYNYVCSTAAKDQQELANYIVTKNEKSKGKKYVAVVADVTTADSKYVINVKNASVHISGGETVAMPMYLPRLTSILANLPINRSMTYYVLEDIDDIDTTFVKPESDVDSWINKGYLVLIKDDDEIKVGRAVNSLTSFTATDTEDMRKIVIVESMNIILEDIYSTFKDYYVGKYKNSYDNQCLLISSINSYFRELAKEEVLDPDYENIAEVDVAAQREAWLTVGKLEAEDWKEDKVKNMSFKSTVFLTGNVKILDAIEDLKFTIDME